MNRSSLVLAAVVAGVVGLVLLVKAGDPGQAGPDAALGTPLPRLGAALVPPGPGQVRGRTAAASLVRAFPAFSAPAADPEERACPCDGECGRTSASCSCEAVRAKADALLASHRRASAALAVATAGDDGTFALTGLAEGTRVDLWSESASGVGRKAGVSVGATDVEVPVEPGIMLEGKVAAPGATSPAEVAVVAYSEELGRLFEGSVDASGRSTFGPVPSTAAWRVLATWGDLRGADRLGPGETSFGVRLEAQALLAGMVVGGGTKVPGAAVRLDAPRCHAETRADADGRFSFSRFGAGGVVVSAEAGGRSAAEAFVLESGAKKEDVVLDLGVGTTLGGVVRGADGKAVAGAEVSYWLRRPSSGVVPGLPIFRRVAPCAADGTWSAAAAAPGPYSLQATAPGFAGSEVSLIEVAAGERKTADLVLQPQSLLAGRVVDPQGKPVEGVEITVRQGMDKLGLGASKKERSERFLQRRKASARSGPDGMFRVEGLAAGSYTLSAAKEGYGHRPEAVTAPDEKVALVLLAAGVVKGEVLDERGAPVAGAEVEISAPRARSSAEGYAGSARRSDRADPAGKFRFGDLPEGRWLIEAAPGDEKHGQASAYASALVDVQPGVEAEVQLRLVPTLTISGVVVDAAGRPLPDARVSGWLEDPEKKGTPRMPGFFLATSAADGTFALRGMDKGSFRVAARKDLYKPGEAEGVQAGTHDVRLQLEGMAAVRGQVLDLQGRPVTAFEANGNAVADPDGRFALAIKRSENMVVTISAVGFAPAVRRYLVLEGSDLDAGKIVLTAGRTVTGKVFDARTREPVSGARVRLGEETVPLGQERTNTGVVLTDESGAFALQVEEGPARLRVEHPRYKSAIVEAVPGVSAVEAPLSPGATLRGRVVDRDGRPQRALIFASAKGGGRAMSEVGSDGTFELSGLAGGKWRVNASGVGESEVGRLSAEVEVPEGGEASVVLRPKTEGATLVVTLKGPGAAANCGGMLFSAPDAARPPSGGVPPSARSQNGTLTFHAVDEGRYTLLVTCGTGKKRTQANEFVDVPMGLGEQRAEIVVPAPQ